MQWVISVLASLRSKTTHGLLAGLKGVNYRVCVCVCSNIHCYYTKSQTSDADELGCRRLTATRAKHDLYHVTK